MSEPWVAWLAVAWLVVGVVVGCGADQDHKLESCGEQSCSGHGECVVTDDGRPLCRCDQGYQALGLTCLAHCLAVNCSDLGGCVVLNGEPRCVCDQGYVAESLECRPAPDSCDGVDCEGRGVCSERNGKPACFCETGYVPVGLSCLANSCGGVRCSDHGVCLLRDGVPSCVCDPGYVAVGLGCALAECSRIDCRAGTCQTGETGPFCSCDFGYVAEGLECRPEACRLEECSGHGGCIEGPTGLACLCDPGYVAVGLSCRPGCAELSCSNHGQCVQRDGQPQCLCDSGYEARDQQCLPTQTLELDGGPDSGLGDGSVASDGGEEPDGGGLIDGSAVDGGDANATAVPGTWVLIDVSTTPFVMGSPPTELGRQEDEVAHEVTLTRDFWMMTTEITNIEFARVVGYNDLSATACGEDCPARSSTWSEFVALANALSQRVGLEQCYECTGTGATVACVPSASFATPYDCPGYRLPMEAEWEFAARGGTTTATYNGDLDALDCTNTVLDDIAWYYCNAGDIPRLVARKEPNAYGLYDVLGNVGEWCHDWSAPYPGGPQTDPTGPTSGVFHVYRGFGITSLVRYTPHVRAAFRGGYRTGYASYHIGARLVRSDL